MDEVTITSKEKLGEYLTDEAEKVKTQGAAIEAMQTAVDEMKAERESEKAERDALKAENEQFAEKIKTLTLVVKARNSWKEETQEGKDLKLADFVQAMLSRSHQTLLKMGATPVRDLGITDPDGWRIPKEYEQRYDAIIKNGRVDLRNEIVTKAGLADPIMVSDTGDTTYYGQYLVPIEYRAELWRAAADASTMMGLVTTVPMRGVTAYVPTTVDALAFTDQGITQDTDATAETLTIARATLTVRNYYSYLPISEEYDQDSLIALGALIRGMYAEAWATLYDTRCLENTTTGVWANTTNEKIMSSGSPNFTDMAFDDLSDTIAMLTTKTKRRGAMFFLHPTVLDIIRKVKNANGDSMWQQPTTAAPGMIWGYPYRETDGMPSATDTAASTKFVLFGNPKTIINGQRLGFEFKIFDQTQSTMEAGQIFLRCRLRQAFVTALPLNWASLKTAAA